MTTILGKKAPSFKAAAVINGKDIVNDFSLDQYLGKKYVVFFFYPKDFTFVCPTELWAFQEKLEEFRKRDCEVVACSTDTEQSHWGWLQMDKKQGGIKGITYPIVADTNKTIAANFGCLNGEYYIDENENFVATSEMIAYRATYLIDKNGIVRHLLINDLPIGRNVDETLRTLEALQFVEKHGEVCPANWTKGKKAMKPTHEGTAEYLATI